MSDNINMSDVNSDNKVLMNLILQQMANSYNENNSKGKKAYEDYIKELPYMNALITRFTSSGNNNVNSIEGFNMNNTDNTFSDNEVAYSIAIRNNNIRNAVQLSNDAVNTVDATTLENTIRILEDKQTAINASSEALNNYWKQNNRDFDNNFNQSNTLKNKVMTADRIINIQEEEYENKIFYSALFAYLLIYLIVVCVLFYVRKPLEMSIQWFGGLLSLTTSIFILMVVKKWIQRNYVLHKINHSVARAVKEIAENPLMNMIDKLLVPCKDECVDKDKNKIDNRPNHRRYSYNSSNPNANNLEMNTDNSENVWTDGDTTGTVGIKPSYPGLPKSLLEKKASNGDVIKNPLTTYTCKWSGMTGTDINPSESVLQTTVPCEYLPGYAPL